MFISFTFSELQFFQAFKIAQFEFPKSFVTLFESDYLFWKSMEFSKDQS